MSMIANALARIRGAGSTIGASIDGDDREFLAVWLIRLVGAASALWFVAGAVGVAIRVFEMAAG